MITAKIYTYDNDGRNVQKPISVDARLCCDGKADVVEVRLEGPQGGLPAMPANCSRAVTINANALRRELKRGVK